MHFRPCKTPPVSDSCLLRWQKLAIRPKIEKSNKRPKYVDNKSFFFLFVVCPAKEHSAESGMSGANHSCVTDFISVSELFLLFSFVEYYITLFLGCSVCFSLWTIENVSTLHSPHQTYLSLIEILYMYVCVVCGRKI